MKVKERVITLAVVVALALLALAPTIARQDIKGWPFSKPLSLGLDLSGGVYLVYEVMTKEAVKGNLQSRANGIKSELKKSKIAVTGVTVNPKSQMEITLLTSAVGEKAKAKIDEDYKDLQFIEKLQDGEKEKLVYGITDNQARQIEEGSINQAVETLRNRVDQFGVAEPLIQRVGETRIQLQMPGYSDIEKVKKVVGSVAKLEFRFLPNSPSSPSITLKDKAGASVKVEEQIAMTGDAVDNAQISVGAGKVEVTLRMTSDGARQFRDITADNVGRQLAIILDGIVYSSPRINEQISGGTASISGQFSVEEAKQLSIVLRSGALPAPLKVAEERTVGPSLGREAIRSGILAIVGGFVAISLFMAWYYRKAGFIAIGTLALNLILLVAALSFFGATLTLPGLAGLGLTIGMAVDSNVIIFERIKDELKRGRARDAAVVEGFAKAGSTIFDTNLTVLVSAVILYLLGTGPVKGFAITLSLGVLTTVFSAVFAARLGFDALKLQGKSLSELSI